MIFSKDTLGVFGDLLNNFSLPASHPDFDRVAAAISGARRELAAAIAEIEEMPPDRAPAN